MSMYHGSRIGGLTTLMPHPHGVIAGESAVFATTDRRFALAMVYGTSDEIDVGYIVDQCTHAEQMYISELRPGAFLQMHAPGVVYRVAEDSFTLAPNLSHVEYVSSTPVRVLHEDPVDDIFEVLRADASIRMIQYGQNAETGMD